MGGVACRPRIWWLGDESGQSTLEYALVLMAFLSTLAALGLMWHATRDGAILHLATEAASHQASGGTVSWLQDLLGF